MLHKEADQEAHKEAPAAVPGAAPSHGTAQSWKELQAQAQGGHRALHGGTEHYTGPRPWAYGQGGHRDMWHCRDRDRFMGASVHRVQGRGHEGAGLKN